MVLYDDTRRLARFASPVIGAARCGTLAHMTGQQTLVLNGMIPAMYDNIPREYDIVTTDSDVKNTFIFSEKDLPGYKKGSKITRGAQTGDAIASKTDDGRVDKTRRFQKAIPSTSN